MMAIQLCEKRSQILECTKNMLILGGPGSGKTTIALIKSVKEIDAIQECQRVLFLSFARATVARVYESASELISREQIKSVEVNTYHGFFWNILKSHGYLLNKKSPLKLINPSDAAVRMSHLKADERNAEFHKIFDAEGIIGFDLFAAKVKEIFAKSNKIRQIYSKAYPVIIVDEFQDTNSEEWEVIQLLGKSSKLIALADADQRIYEFRGADPARIGQLITAFSPETFDFGNENNRSNGTDIVMFGNDLLSGANKSKTYNDVQISYYRYYSGKHEMFSLKTNLLSALARVKSIENWSIAILVPTKSQMLTASNYLSSQHDNLPVLTHDVAIDAEGPALAGALFAKLMESCSSVGELKVQIIQRIINHLKGRNGSKPSPKADLELAKKLELFLDSGKGKIKILKEIDIIAAERAQMKMTGNPLDDWLSNIKLFAEHSTVKALITIREDARYVRLLHKGSYLRESLANSWRNHRQYINAETHYKDAIQQENFSSTVKKFSGIYIMTIHKSKGKQFDEVFIFEGYRRGRIVSNPNDQGRVNQSRLTLRVGVTRAMKKTTILSPAGNKYELL